MATARVPRSVKRRRAIPGEDPAAARLMAMVAALTSQLAIVRERLDTVERLAEAAGLFTQAQIEAYDPPPGASVERDALRQRHIERVFRPLRDDAAREAEAAGPAAKSV